MEIYEDLKDLDYLIVPIGGGGLSSGSIFATRFFSPKTKIIGAEPELASDAYLSLKKGSIVPPMPPISIADGLRTGVGTIHTLLQGAITFPILQEGLDEIVTVSEEEIIKATFMMWRSLKIFVETSSAVVLAGMLKR
jgi:threonine dehydratase